MHLLTYYKKKLVAGARDRTWNLLVVKPLPYQLLHQIQTTYIFIILSSKQFLCSFLTKEELVCMVAWPCGCGGQYIGQYFFGQIFFFTPIFFRPIFFIKFSSLFVLLHFLLSPLLLPIHPLELFGSA